MRIGIRIMRAFVEIRQIVVLQPEYEILREKMRRIEAEVKDIKTNQLVEADLSSRKVSQLSSDV